jgi:ABC-type lipoprotein release transport system permease subunit
MFKYLKIAWRNLWRNTRRTLITSASVFFGVFFAIMMTSIQKGSFENMIGNMAMFYSGYIQIQQKNFKETPGVNNSYELPTQLEEIIKNNSQITSSTKRVETFALASNEEQSYPSLIIGVEPGKEDKKSGLSKYIIKGNYLENNSKDLMVGRILADNLKIGVGDSLILLSQGYHGTSAAGIYKIQGILDFPLPALNKQIIYMDIANSQNFASIPGKITSNIIMVENTDETEAVLSELIAYNYENIIVYSWQELMPELLNLIEGKESSGVMIKSLLFMIIGFGVWATIMMMMHERKRELGVMIAIGFQKGKLLFMMLIETVLIGVIGVVSGIIISYPIFFYLFHNPIIITGEMAETYESMGFEAKLAFSINPDIFYNPAITVLIIFMLVSLYQIYFVARLNVVKSLKS